MMVAVPMKSRSYGRPGDGRPVYLQDTRISFHGLPGYVEAVQEEVADSRAASTSYARLHALYRSVTTDDIRSCFDLAALRRAERLFDLGRYERSHSGMGSGDEKRRGEIAGLLVETRNQIARLERGIYRVRAKGPTLDPARIPDDRLRLLIQSHRDMDVVDRLRDELQQREQRSGKGEGDRAEVSR